MEDELKQAEQLVEWLEGSEVKLREEVTMLKLKLTAKQRELNSIQSALVSMEEAVTYMKGEDPNDQW